MKIIKEEDKKILSINTSEINIESGFTLSKISREILKILNNKPMYPKEIAKKLEIHEQNIYYNIKKLEKNKLIKVIETKEINGSIAKFYGVSSESFFFKIDDFKESSKLIEKKSTFLSPFIENGNMNSLIVVGSPDPHGPLKARSKDGYFGIDFALFIGSFLTRVDQLNVKLDTEIQNDEIRNNNLIIIGGPIVNKITGQINNSLPIYFDEKRKGIFSKITKKLYVNDETGMIIKTDNPFNKEKKILVLCGIRNSGTRASILAFLKHFQELKKGNVNDKEINARVVEGIDFDSDGIVDDVEFLE